MKSTGIVRRIDNLGRIVLPKELRRTLRIGDNDSLEIYVEDEAVILRKYEPVCVFCAGSDDLVRHNGKYICFNCIKDLNNK